MLNKNWSKNSKLEVSLKDNMKDYWNRFKDNRKKQILANLTSKSVHRTIKWAKETSIKSKNQQKNKKIAIIISRQQNHIIQKSVNQRLDNQSLKSKYYDPIFLE